MKESTRCENERMDRQELHLEDLWEGDQREAFDPEGRRHDGEEGMAFRPQTRADGSQINVVRSCSHVDSFEFFLLMIVGLVPASRRARSLFSFAHKLQKMCRYLFEKGFKL